MKMLFLKEARSLAFGASLLLVWLCADWSLVFLAEFPDQKQLAGLTVWRRGNLTGMLVLFAAAVALAQGVLVREQDEGTLKFLDALPVSRDRVFAVKFLLALGVVWLLPLSTIAQRICLQCLSRDSLDMEFHWDVLMTELGLRCAMGFVFLSMGMAVSFLRRFAYVALGLWGCGLIVLRVFRGLYAAELNPFTITWPVFDGQRWLVPWEHLTVQLLVGVACLWVALRSYRELGDRASRLEELWARHRRGGLIAAIGLALAVLLWGTSSFLTWKQEDDAREKGDSEPTIRVVKARHEFVHRYSDTPRAEDVIAKSEDLRTQIEQFLGVTVRSRLVVDMTGGLERHAGRAYWKKIRMSLSGGVRDQAVFAHELTHVLLEQAARGRLEDSFNSTRFFHEGLATFVERSWFPLTDGGDMEGAHRVAAVARAWHELRFEELVDDKRLSLRLDRDLVYPVGAVLVDALVRRHGTNAPGRVAAAFGRPDAPKGLSGMTLWRDTMQSCGFNLSEVVADFYVLLDLAAERNKQFIAELPRLQGAVEIVGDQVLIRAVHNGTASTEDLHCRVRQSAEAYPQFDLHFRIYDKDQFRVPKSKLPGRSFSYQLGVKHRSVPHIIYEPWVEARLL